MRVLHVSASLDPSQGGPSVSAPSLASAQAKLGCDVAFAYQTKDGGGDNLEKSLATIPDSGLLKFYGIPQQGMADRLLALTAATQLAHIVPDYDIIHLHGIWDPILIRAALTAGRLKKKYIFSPRGMLDPWSLGQKRFKKQLALTLILRRIFAGSGFIHALNTTEADFIQRLNLRCPVKIFPNGIYPEKFESLPAPGLFYKMFPVLKERPYILFMSRLHYKKGLDFVADAFAGIAGKNKDIDLVVAGPDEGAQKDFVERIDRYGLHDRVHIVGPLYGEKKYLAFRDALCFLLPSRQEGFSMVILEAMASGAAVVISENCHFPEVAEFQAGEVVPLEIDKIVDALMRIINDHSYRENLGKKARGLILSKYSWHTIAKDMLAEYENSVPHD